MKYFLLVVCCSMLVTTTMAQKKSPEAIIAATMEQQLKDWNSGNVEGFMKAYWNNDSLMFIGKNGPTYGYNNTLNNYKTGYPNAAAMGELSFTIIKVQPLSAQYYSVVGKWHLKRTIGDVGGAFTLLFKKINGQWLIIQDHSS
ncbi:YybH family protein [Ferruginibacter yonginensis]|uniref:YybH family protein n=1 Tax=Ferruginibacter yonginensis TaxID=1310416 RepID=A0ABV8QU76_9BACT